jgi:surface carbohydrate biosynthesis protein
MRKIIIFLKLILRSKFIFKTPKKCDLIVFDEVSIYDLNICLSKFNFFVLQTRLESSAYILGSKAAPIYKIYFSYKIFKKFLKNYFKGNLFTVYLISLIELINPKVVLTTIDVSFKFSEIAKILDKKTNFIAIQNALTHDFLNWDYLYKTRKIKQNLIKKLYIPNLFCMGDYDREMWEKLNIKVKNFFPIGNLRLANFFHHIKSENSSPEKYNCDICLVAEMFFPTSKNIFEVGTLASKFNEDRRTEEEGFVKLIKYTIKFCLKHNMKLIIPLKRDKKHLPGFYNLEIEYYDRNFEKEELEYIKSNILEKDRENFSSYRVLLNSKVVVSTKSTLLRNKLTIGGKILSCNLSKKDRYNFPVNGICTLNNCFYEEFEERLLEIYSISEEDYFSKIDKKPDYREKFNKNYSAIDLIREKLIQLGVNKN